MKRLFVLFILCQCHCLFAQKKVTANFYIVDSLYSEPISNVAIQINNSVIFTNDQGRTSIVLSTGVYEAKLFYEGNDLIIQNLLIKRDTIIYLILKKKINQLPEIGIYAKRNDVNLQNDKYSLSGNLISKASLPGSNNDPIHLIKLLPGISTTQEMNSNINLRGSTSYGTCIFLDDIPLPNYSHSFGFFSLYDSKTLRGIDYYTSEVSSVYGFRGAGYIQFLTHDPYLNKATADISVTPFLTSLNINSKIIPGKVGLFIHYRKSMFSNAYNKKLDNEVNDGSYRPIPLFSKFDDALIKLKIASGKKSNIYITYFTSKDKNYTKFDSGTFVSDSSNWKINSLSLKHESTTDKGILINTSLFFNHSGISRFDHFNTDYTASSQEINYKQTIIFPVKRRIKYLMGYEFSSFLQKNKLASGAIYQLPGAMEATILSFYTDLKFTNKTLNLYWNVRPIFYSPVKNVFLETRSGIRKTVGKSSVFLEVNKFIQFKHVLSNNLLPFPQDFQFLSDNQFKPLITKEFLTGLNKAGNRLEWKSNLYYRIFQNALDYKSLYSENLNSNLNISSVKQFSYGIENSANLKINKKHNVFIAYTFSRVFIQNDSANSGLRYPANYDRPHIFNLLYTYKFKKFDFTSTFTFQNGRPITVPIYIAYMGVPFYSNRNAERLPYYHKLDIGFNYHFRPQKHFQQTLQIHIYNVYMHKNAYSLVWEWDNKGAYKFFYLSVLPIMPSFNYSIQIR